MTNGVLTGGWGYVVAAYGISWTVLIVYGVSLFIRSRRST